MPVKLQAMPDEEAARKRLAGLSRCPTNYGHRINFQNCAKGDLANAFSEIDRLRKLLTTSGTSDKILETGRSRRPVREESATHE
jgi:hypothetical protein